MNDTEFNAYVNDFQGSLRELLESNEFIETTNHLEGISIENKRKLLEKNPLSVFIPSRYGGLGDDAKQCLSLLEAAAYESIAVALALGINGSLFLEPVSKYCDDSVKPHIFNRFLKDKAMGGLMITEPEYGTDALSMQTAYQEKNGGYVIQGKKHWGGLTGLADFWLVTARQKKDNGVLARGIELFVCEMSQPQQRIIVEEYYHKIGLFLIPYGLNQINLSLPKENKLIPHSSGLKLMMDLLHRSRLRLSGIGIGFIKRMLDEAIEHCRTRNVGGKSLSGYDQVQKRLSYLQAWYTVNSAMCLYASKVSATEADLAGYGLEANSTKAVLTDMMQASAQSLLQLTGAKGYRRDHIAGRAIVDSRPFQIFEGSNDVMYSQIADMIIKEMKRKKTQNLFGFFSDYKPTSKSAAFFRDYIDLSIDLDAIQRIRINLGKITARIVTTEFVLELMNSGYRNDLAENAIQVTKEQVAEFATGLSNLKPIKVVEDYYANNDWKLC